MNPTVLGVIFLSCLSLLPYVILALRPEASSVVRGILGMVDDRGLLGVIVTRGVCHVRSSGGITIR